MTVGDEANDEAILPVASSIDSNVQRRVPARVRVAAKAVTQRVSAAGTAVSRDIRRIPVFRDPPPAVAELVAYTRSGDWVPGERSEWLEFFGRAYGWLVAVPVSLGLYSVAWLLQRPMRVLFTCLVISLVWLAH